MKRLFIISAAFLFFTLLLSIIFTVPYAKKDDLLSCETNNSKYSNASYCVRLITYKYVFKNTRTLIISAGKDNTYGQMVGYPEVMAPQIEKIKTEWLENGLKITTPLGYEVFTPKALYQSGR